ncbi:unnamed protein product [Rhizophagus irregularis]|nr:unnamed protein product [Rhizophagus irregularis]
MNGLGPVGNFCGEKYYTEYEASKSNPSKRLVYGMTRNPLTNDYAVIERLVDRYPDCHKEWMSLRWCRDCNPKHFESERHKWTSGNSEIDDFILETQITAEFSDQALEWIPETQLTEFKLIEKGEGVKEFLEEIKAMHQCRKVNLDRLWSLTIDFRSLHRSGLIHRDLHSGNVLFGDNRRNFVADLGLACKDGQNITGEIKGVLPYVAPEIHCRQPHTKASDIYSFVFVMEKGHK